MRRLGFVQGRTTLAAALIGGIALIAANSPAAARSHGINGVSGMDGLSCGNTGAIGCHVTTGAPNTPVDPIVSFEGPTEVEASSVTTYRFVVVSQAPADQTHAGLDVAAGAGVLGLIDGQGTRLLQGEVTHTDPQENDSSGTASWEFTWQAPDTPGTYALFGAGNSVNFDGDSTGDASSTAVLMITVGGGAPTPTPTATPAPACAGDCNGDGVVAVNELISGVNIALGSASVDACMACDLNGDGAVSVNELVSAVSKALNGC